MTQTSFYKDMNGDCIELFDNVLVPEPTNTDLHNNEFNGMVDSLKNGMVTVVDGDGNYFDIEPERLEKED